MSHIELSPKHNIQIKCKDQTVDEIKAELWRYPMLNGNEQQNSLHFYNKCYCKMSTGQHPSKQADKTLLENVKIIPHRLATTSFFF